ncbi:MAG: hypothetical protein KGO53_06205 [Alphaproteobacteria bacterium]|nr:hypothetical protein [Alphaproteobacteria bacterium]
MNGLKAWAMLGLAVPLWAGVALADSSTAEKAAEMLARAQSLDMKCSYLSAAQKDELSKLVARAELALANREPIEATKAAMQRGRDAGLAAACSADEKQSLTMLLNAAREAASAAAAEPQAEPAAPVPATPALSSHDVAMAEKPVAESKTADPVFDAPVLPKAPGMTNQPATAAADIKVQDPVQPLAKPAEVNVKKPKLVGQMAAAPAKGNLGSYAKLTQAYFLASRCNSKNPAQIGAMYSSIVNLHDSLMQGHSAREVAAVLNGARARASASSCS